jgi:RNA polymerase sigma factor (sigma-70 family)
MAEPPDPVIAKRIASGDSQAEKEFFSNFGEQIKLMVWARLKRKVALAEREDIVSEVQEAVLLSLRKGGYDPATGKPLAAYIAGIAIHIVGQFFRRQKKGRVVEAGVVLDHHADPQNILSDLLDAERDRILRKCLQRLPSKYKEALLLRIYEQHSIEEISASLGIERRRVSERIHYAFQLLAKECQKENYFQY